MAGTSPARGVSEASGTIRRPVAEVIGDAEAVGIGTGAGTACEDPASRTITELGPSEPLVVRHPPLQDLRG